jgi:hypothetical protein
LTHQNFRLTYSAKFLAERHRQAVVDNREILPSQIRSTERIQFGNANISYQQAWRTREVLRLEIEGDEAKSFRRIPGLLNAWTTEDSDNYGILECENGQFKWIFIAPQATRHAFQVCRPFVALDGCHTKSRYRMTLLIASTLDANNEILPLAWAIVLIKDSDNWRWFLYHLKGSFVGINTSENVRNDFHCYLCSFHHILIP